MSPMQKDHYDQTATIFSPEGRIYQVEYSREAIKRGGLALGIVFKNGILFTIDKSIFSPLVEEEKLDKFFRITPEIGAAASGLIADARVLVDILREKAQEEIRKYGEKPDLRNLILWISKIYEVYTRYEGVRPFGTALIIGGFDPSGFHLYETDPSGVYQKRKATAIGKGSEKAIEILEDKYDPSMTRDKAVMLALSILRQTMEERPQDDQKGEEIHILTKDGFETLDQDQRDELEKKMEKGPAAHKKSERTVKPEKETKKGEDLKDLLETVPKLSIQGKEAIIERFGDLASLKKARIDDLTAIKGIGKATADRIIKALKAL